MSELNEEIEELLTLHNEADTRRYEARWGFYKVVFGTTIVGVVAAILPYWIQIVQERSKQTNDYRSFVSQYIENGISQDIELRIRFAEYFSYLADDASRNAWAKYHVELKTRRDNTRDKINSLEKERANLIAQGDDDLSEEDQIALAELSRKLSWAYGEVGYAQRNTSIVQRQDSSTTRAIGIEDLDPAYLEEFSKFFSDNDVKYVKPEEVLVMGSAHHDVGNRCYGLNGPPPKAMWPNIVGVTRAIDELRDRTDADVTIISAFRTPQYNLCIGSATRSVQMTFLGVDVSSSNWSAAQLATFFRSIREEGVFEGGVGEYDTFVHLDARGTRADWSQ
ncbi:D-Ala-D-Ala carboxypeptidase family metallohydrolase [Sedimentitalea todarodis]|uniref:D-Ala-D-Ala carboxypeptidase family metallohydrolase n=1 Tax=Sedimentitalea todarodis TaxID=1631240 RepID=A0ABU3VL42_9RHOB|nr:D-Ala-D-Ala carboxypeptidase family metallohydrolase [Sedimentitalea todarodis]MDU9006881.1 D-Ala-D-Ala carboxypeptidase family metallohydrolase [Sedimentitalea todarodis]